MKRIELAQLADTYARNYTGDEAEEFLPEARRQILREMLIVRCENYGYDWRDFRRISRQRSDARRRLICLMSRGAKLDWCNLSKRWNRQTGEYTVGQSYNEELTNQIRVLVGLKGWVS